MKNHNYLLLLCFPFFLWNTICAQTIQKSVYFETAKHELSLEAQTTLNSICKTVDSLSTRYDVRVRLYAHTDFVGSNDYNQALSERRAESSRSFITANCPDISIQEVNPFGEKQPVANNDVDTGRQLNRRVDIYIDYQKKETIHDLYQLLRRAPQRFCINPTKDTTLVCEDGSVLLFKANTLDVPASCKNECVTIEVREDFEKSEMILDNLITISNGKTLESAGMIQVEAFDCDNQKIGLLPNASFTTLLPEKYPIPNPQLFIGNRDPHDSTMNWLITPLERIDVIDVLAFASCDRWRRAYEENKKSCADCRFFCRIGRINYGINGLKDKKVKEENRTFRKCQKGNRIARRNQRKNIQKPLNPQYLVDSTSCANLNDLMKKYGVNNVDALNNILLKEQMEKYGVTSKEALYDTIAKINRQRQLERERAIEEKVLNNQGTAQETSYYIFKNTSFGWRNIDCFSAYPKNKLIPITVNEKPKDNTDVKLAFTKIRSVIGMAPSSENYTLSAVPNGEEAWLIGLRINNGKAYLSMEKIVVTKETEYVLKFKEVTIPEMKEALEKLNK